MPILTMHLFPEPERPTDGLWRGYRVGNRRVLGVSVSGWPVLHVCKGYTICVDSKGDERRRGVSEVLDWDTGMFMEDKDGRLSGYRLDSDGDWRPDETVLVELTARIGGSPALARHQQAKTGRWAKVPQSVKDELHGWIVTVSGGLQAPDLYLHGIPGCGKSTTLTALADELREQGVQPFTVEAVALATATRDGYSRPDARQASDSMWSGLRDARVAILDDPSAGFRVGLGDDKKKTDGDLWALLQGVLDHRKRTGNPIVFADNNGVRALRDGGLDPRLVDRLSAFQPITFPAVSYRRQARLNPNGGSHD